VADDLDDKQNHNENWEAEIAAYDEECRRRDREFSTHHYIVKESGSQKLTEEENEVLKLYLNGMTCPQIAEMFRIETEVVTSLMEIIRLKLSLDE